MANRSVTERESYELGISRLKQGINDKPARLAGGSIDGNLGARLGHGERGFAIELKNDQSVCAGMSNGSYKLFSQRLLSYLVPIHGPST